MLYAFELSLFLLSMTLHLSLIFNIGCAIETPQIALVIELAQCSFFSMFLKHFGSGINLELQDGD